MPRSRGFIISLSLALLLVAAVACAWPAEVFLAGMRRGLAWRIALLPGGRELVWSCGVAAVAAATLAWYEWRRRGAGASSSASHVIWLAALLLPFLPIAGDVFPGLLVFDGPMQWVVLAAVAVASAWHPLRQFARRVLVPGFDALASRPLVLLVLAFLLYAGVGLRTTAVQGVGGDEPHYLIIVESLLRDHDLRIENNHRQGDGAAFGVPQLAPHYLRRGRAGVIYSIHAPGLPVLIAPAYAVGGRAGATVFLALIASLAGLAIFLLARALGGHRAALVTWAGIGLTTPFLLESWLIFPETPAACAVAWAMWWLWTDAASTRVQEAGAAAGAGPVAARPDPRGTRVRRVAAWVLRGVVVASLPWLHTKFVVLLAGFALLIGLRLVRRPLPLIAFLAPIAASIAAWYWFFYALYGVADPTIPYGGAAGLRRDISWAFVPRGVLGLVFDQEFGIVPYSPFYLVALAGIAPLVRRRDARWIVAATVVAGGAFLIGMTRYFMWWGGASVPGRFAVPALPFVAPLLALGVKTLSRVRWGPAVCAALLFAGVGAAAAMLADPGAFMMFNDRDGTGRFLDWLQGSGQLTWLFPSFTGPDWTAQLPRTALVLAALALSLAATWQLDRRSDAGTDASQVRADLRSNRLEGGSGDSLDEAPNAGGLAVAFIVLLFVALGMLPRMLPGRLPADPPLRESQLKLLWAWRPASLFDVSRWQRPSGHDVLARLRIPIVRADARAIVGGGSAPTLVGPFPLPPGGYELRASLGPGSASGEWRVLLQRPEVVLTSAPATAGLSTARFALPNAFIAPPIWISASDPSVMAQVSRVELLPLLVTDHDTRTTVRPVAFGPLAEWPGGIRGHFDGNAFSEGDEFWTWGGRTTRLLIVPAGAELLRIRLRAGAGAGTARLETNRAANELRLAPGEVQTVEIPVTPTGDAEPLALSFSGGFRPADIEPSSHDRRWLGIRVRISGARRP